MRVGRILETIGRLDISTLWHGSYCFGDALTLGQLWLGLYFYSVGCRWWWWKWDGTGDGVVLAVVEEESWGGGGLGKGSECCW